MADDGAAVMKAVLEAGARVPLHRHIAQDERFEILGGRGRMRLGARTFDLDPGDVVDVTAGRAHAVRNPGPEPLRLVARLSPGWGTAEFFGDLFAEADAGHVSPGGRPTPAAFGRLAHAHGDDLPWLPLVPVGLQRMTASLFYRVAGS